MQIIYIFSPVKQFFFYSLATTNFLSQLENTVKVNCLTTYKIMIRGKQITKRYRVCFLFSIQEQVTEKSDSPFLAYTILPVINFITYNLFSTTIPGDATKGVHITLKKMETVLWVLHI